MFTGSSAGADDDDREFVAKLKSNSRRLTPPHRLVGRRRADRWLTKIPAASRADRETRFVEDILTRSDGLVEPRGLAIDPRTATMYWADAGTGMIASSPSLLAMRGFIAAGAVSFETEVRSVGVKLIS